MEKLDREFLINILFQIRDYAFEHNYEPDETIEIVANNMLSLLEIATFNGKETEVENRN